jgi:hypothetical protein
MTSLVGPTAHVIVPGTVIRGCIRRTISIVTGELSDTAQGDTPTYRLQHRIASHHHSWHERNKSAEVRKADCHNLPIELV